MEIVNQPIKWLLLCFELVSKCTNQKFSHLKNWISSFSWKIGNVLTLVLCSLLARMSWIWVVTADSLARACTRVLFLYLAHHTYHVYRCLACISIWVCNIRSKLWLDTWCTLADSYLSLSRLSEKFHISYLFGIPTMPSTIPKHRRILSVRYMLMLIMKT